MPGFISLQDQGYFQPGPVMQDSIRQSIANQLARQQQQQQQQQFATEQAVRQASAAPQTDPSVVSGNVAAAKSTSESKAKDAAFIATLPTGLRAAWLKGQIPQQNDTSSSFGPGGATVTKSQNSIDSGQRDPQGNPIFAPMASNTTTTPPQLRTATTIVPPAAGEPQTPGLAKVRTDSYVLTDPTKADTPDNRRIIESKEGVQRTTPPRGDAAILEFAQTMGVDPDDLKEMVTGLVNKKSATAPADPNAMKPTAEWSQNNVNLVKLKAQLRQTSDPDQQSQIQDQIDKLSNRNKFLSTPKKTTADALAELLGPDSNPGPDASGKSAGTPTPPDTAGKTAAATGAQPVSAANGGIPRPQAPARTGAAAPVQPASTKFVDGKTYTDGQGRKAKWSATQNKFVPIAASP